MIGANEEKTFIAETCPSGNVYGYKC